MKKRIEYIICIIFAILCLAGCQNDDETAITTDFLEDTVFTVGTERVSLAEWYLYEMPQIGAIEAMYGKDIWKYHISDDEGDMSDVMKQDIMDQIVYVKVVCERAEQLGIALNEDELGDIEAETLDYMGRLTSEQKSRYGITEDIVRSVYCDNLLAMKVYENLTLNIDTNIPDEEVRHMIIEYICANKTYETGDDTTQRYSDEELAAIREQVENLYQTAISDEEITRLGQLDNEKYGAIELVTDYAGLKEKFPKDLADLVFGMSENEILGVYDTEDAFFVFDCVKYKDEETTDEARVRIIEQRQRELFEEEYGHWEAETVTKLNYAVWDTISIGKN